MFSLKLNAIPQLLNKHTYCLYILWGQIQGLIQWSEQLLGRHSWQLLSVYQNLKWNIITIWGTQKCQRGTWTTLLILKQFLAKNKPQKIDDFTHILAKRGGKCKRSLSHFQERIGPLFAKLESHFKDGEREKNLPDIMSCR